MANILAPQAIFTAAGDMEGVAAGDFDNDGVIDIVSANNTNDTASIYLSRTKLATALADLDISSTEKAQKLIGILDVSLETLAKGQLASDLYLTRLGQIIDFNLLQAESLSEAKSRVEDVDIALETAELVRLQILEQAQIAVIGQGNIQAQMVIQLLGVLDAQL